MKTFASGGALALALTPAPVLACASCGCTFASDWLQHGLVTQPGQALTLRYDYIAQTRLREGTEPVDRATITLPAAREVEQVTYNHLATLSYDRQWANDWGVSLALPFISRPHRTIAAGDMAESASSASGLGDLSVNLRWQGLSTPRGVTGLTAGLVVPTGSWHQQFVRGPQAGQPLDRGLQPGSGTVQLALGAYHYRRLGRDFAVVAQVQGQAPLAEALGYRPGALGEGSVALQYLGLGRITPSLQLNLRVQGQDRGVNADTDNSGGEVLSLAPGLAARLGGGLSAFGRVQVPLYRRVIGWQLAPRAVFSGGVQLRF